MNQAPFVSRTDDDLLSHMAEAAIADHEHGQLQEEPALTNLLSGSLVGSPKRDQ